MIALSSLSCVGSLICERSFLGVVKTSSEFVVDNLLSGSKRILQLLRQSVEAAVADSLFLATCLRVLVFKSSLTGNLSCCGSLSLESTSSLGIGVEFLHKSSVLKRVLVGGFSCKGSGADSAKLALNLIRVDDSGKISYSHQTSVELIATLLNTLLSVGTKYLVEVSEGILGEDNKSTKVTAGSELQKVKSVNAAGVNSWKISSSSLEERVLITVNKEWSLSRNETRISHLVLTSTGSSALTNSLEIT